MKKIRLKAITENLPVIFVALIFLFVSYQPAQAEREKFLFGSAIALTGKFAREGASLKFAYDLWAEKVNAKGGIEVGGKKYPVEIIYYDDKSDPKTTTKLVEKLITEDKVDLIFGPFSSLCVGPSSTIAEKYKVPMIEAAGNATPLFQRGFKYLFCTLRLAEDQPEAFMRLLAKQSPRPNTVAIIAPKSPFYLSSAKGYKKHAEKYGFKVVHYETYPVEMEDITPVLQKVKGKNPDALCVGSHTVVAMMVMKQSKEIGFNPKAYGFSFGTSNPEFVKELGKDAEYVCEFAYLTKSSPFSDPFFGTTRQLFESFEKGYGGIPDGTQSSAVTAGFAFLTAIQKAGVTPPLTEEKRIKVRDELSKIDILTSAGAVRFNEVGINEANPLGMIQMQNGKLVCVDPEDWAMSKFVYPAPKWSER